MCSCATQRQAKLGCEGVTYCASIWEGHVAASRPQPSLASESGSPRFRRQKLQFSHQIRSVAQSCPTLCDPMNRSTPGLPVHHQLPKFIQTHVHQVSDAIQPSHPLSSPSLPAFNLSQHQGLFQGVSSSYQVGKVLEF